MSQRASLLSPFWWLSLIITAFAIVATRQAYTHILGLLDVSLAWTAGGSVVALYKHTTNGISDEEWLISYIRGVLYLIAPIWVELPKRSYAEALLDNSAVALVHKYLRITLDTPEFQQKLAQSKSYLYVAVPIVSLLLVRDYKWWIICVFVSVVLNHHVRLI